MAIVCVDLGSFFVGEIVWWYLFEGYELGDFYKSLDVECSISAYDYGNYFDVCF